MPNLQKCILRICWYSWGCQEQEIIMPSAIQKLWSTYDNDGQLEADATYEVQVYFKELFMQISEKEKKWVCYADFKATLAHWLLTSPEWIFIYSERNPCNITFKRWRPLRNGSFVAAFLCENKTQIEWRETKHGSKPCILIQFSHFPDYHHKICLVFAIINHEETTHVLDMLFQAQATTVTGIFRVKRRSKIFSWNHLKASKQLVLNRTEEAWMKAANYPTLITRLVFYMQDTWLISAPYARQCKCDH